MISRRAMQSKGGRRFISVLLLVAVCIFVVLAWQSISTEKYALYRDNLSRYLSEIEECEAMANGPYAANYQYLASEWRQLADDARSYLTQHRAGAISLIVVAGLCMVAGLYLMITSFRRHEVDVKSESEAKNKKGSGRK